LYPLVDLPYLKHLRIESESINGDMNWIYNLPKLESIELIISEPTFDIERILIGSKNLRVAGFKDINYEAAYFSIAENVTILSIYSYEMTITSLPPRLEVLYLYHATLIDFDKAIEYPNLTKVIMDRVTNCHQLLSRCPNLTKLTLKSMRNFHLIEFPNVIDLEFFRCSMTDLSFLTNFPRLKRVTFIWCQLSPQDIEYWSSRVTLVIKKE
jgi:hypothetical protein